MLLANPHTHLGDLMLPSLRLQIPIIMKDLKLLMRNQFHTEDSMILSSSTPNLKLSKQSSTSLNTSNRNHMLPRLLLPSLRMPLLPLRSRKKHTQP